MKSTLRRFWPAVLLALCGFVPSAFADTSVTVTGVQGPSLDGIYDSPYYATVGSTTNATVICDDFDDDSVIGKTYTGSVMAFSSLNSSTLGNTLWGAKLGSSALGLYNEAAWLAEGLLQLVSTPKPNATIEGYYSYAIWAVFDPNGVLAWLKSYGDTAACNYIFGNGNNCASTAVSSGGLLYNLAQNSSKGNYSNLALITPLILGPNHTEIVCTPGTGSCPAQEFFMRVAEGGAAFLYLLLAAAACFGAMYFRSPRPKTATKTA